VIAGAGAGDVKQVARGVVYHFEIGECNRFPLAAWQWPWRSDILSVQLLPRPALSLAPTKLDLGVTLIHSDGRAL
jgi:hypothetical protein